MVTNKLSKMRVVDKQQVHKLILEAIEAAGSQKGFAKLVGVSSAMVSLVVHKKRNPDEGILNYIGIKKETIYLTSNK